MRYYRDLYDLAGESRHPDGWSSLKELSDLRKKGEIIPDHPDAENFPDLGKAYRRVMDPNSTTAPPISRALLR